ncbi:MAG: phytanoyl-CoA dioxygenase family protein [Actinomycetota bacterium]
MTEAQDIDFERYCAEGRERALTLGNRGPVRFIGDGALHPDIVEAYWRTGFYVFEGLVGSDELADIEADIADFRRRLPVTKDSAVDIDGNPAIAADLEARCIIWGKPLSDPVGGTSASHGRHPVKMHEPTPETSAPTDVAYVVLGTLQFIDAHLRLYGHPDLLGIAAALNGDDFVPFNEGIFIKDPGLGPSVAWHRDGVTHWESPDWDQGSHGFNFMAQVHGCGPENGVWVLPGTHKQRHVNMGEMVASVGSDRLPDAVPLVCEPGDVAVVNRQAIHGSFPNTSADARITLNLGFHRRASVLGQTGSGIHGKVGPLDDARVATRSRMIGWGIAARAARFPGEPSFDYRPLRGETFAWDDGSDAARAELHDYNLLDLSI